MTSACRPLTAWRRLAAPLCAAVLLVPGRATVAAADCVRTSFAAAPRSYAVPDGPVSTAVADFNKDGQVDLAVATLNDARIRVRQGGAGDFTTLVDLDLGPFLPLRPRAVATADFDFDGQADIVAALGGTGLGEGELRFFLRDDMGAFVGGPSLAAGTNTSALAVGDFDGNGSPDVAAVSEGDGGVWVFLGDGAGGFTPATGNPVLSGLNAPRALVAADLTGDGLADLAIAESGGSAVHVLRSNGGGTPFFTLITTAGVGLPVATHPEGIAAADLDGDGRLDLVTADTGKPEEVGPPPVPRVPPGVSVILRSGGGFLGAVAYAVGDGPSAVALVDLDGDPKPDIAVTTTGSRMLTLLVNDGNGLFPTSSDHPVRNYPRAVTPVDVDADGQLDLAVTCQSADAVVVLLSRRPGPPVLAAAPWVSVGSRPRAVVSADLDGDGDLDLAVANRDSNSVSLLRNDPSGVFTSYRTLDVGAGPEAIVAGDFNGDGRVDLALNAPLAATKGVSILFGSTIQPGEFGTFVPVGAGSVPDALAAGDFDGDGDLDLAVCDKQTSGAVLVLKNDGTGAFPETASTVVASQPTAIVAADFDGDGDLDLAVGNEGADNVQILWNSGGSFSVGPTPLTFSGTDPLSLAAADFDADGAVDLAVAAFGGDRLHVYRNQGGGTFTMTTGPFDAPNLLESVTAADINLDGRPDLLAVATGLSVFRGRGAMDFDPPETVVGRRGPWAAAVGDFNQDGWPDVAMVNEISNDVSLLLSTACQARRLEVSLHPAACGMGPPDYVQYAQVTVFDEGGNVATGAAGTVTPSIVSGTGDPLATLGGAGAGGLPLTSGVASFTGLTIDRPGRRYRLQFSLSGVSPVQTRSFTLGPELQLVGPAAICVSSSATFRTEGGYDQYAWTLDPPAPPFAFTPTVVLDYPSLNPGLNTLSVAARVDGCSPSVSRSVEAAENLESTSLTIQGFDTVCVDCIGGTITPNDIGGGPAQSRQWGYRTAAGVGTPIEMPGETGETYVLKGASFPGPGTYYVVVRTTPSCGSPGAISSELAVTVVSGVPDGEVQHLAASSRGTTSAGGQNRLQWVNSTGMASEVRVRWNKAPAPNSPCLPPASINAPFDGEHFVLISPPLPTVSSFLHTDDGGSPGLDFDTAYCYTVFVKVGTDWSAGRTVRARPFNADLGPLKWTYATGATAVVPPVVGHHAILAMSNDQTVHALTRGGASGGFWPPLWVPRELGGVAHSRSPVVPFTVPVNNADTALFVGDDSGDVQAFNGETGQPVWVAPTDVGRPITGAPGGLFAQYGGIRDLIVVGTRADSGSNALHGLDLATGSPVGMAFTAQDNIGAISGSPVIDYATQRVYFASRSLGGPTIWCVEVDPSTPFTACGDPWNAGSVGDVDGSLVLRNTRLYFGNTTGTVYSLSKENGGEARTFTTGDGSVKGFLFPDRRNDDLIFATDTKVWSISDDGSDPIDWNWQWTDPVNGLNPSLVLYWPRTNYVYVGSKDGKLYELDFTYANKTTPPTHKVLVLGDGTGQIGAPTLDIGVEPPDVSAGKKLLIVGSESGVLYGVEVPF